MESCDIDHVVFTGSVEGGLSVHGIWPTARAWPSASSIAGWSWAARTGPTWPPMPIWKRPPPIWWTGPCTTRANPAAGSSASTYIRIATAISSTSAPLLAAAYVLGDPRQHATTMGPLATAKSAEDMLHQVEAARAKGAEVVAGGRARKVGKGTFFEPTLITNADHRMEVMREENFGPILPMVPVRDDEEAVRLMNDSPYGLTSAIYTRDQERAERFAAGADTGTVFMNRCDYLDPALPWTGCGTAGGGRPFEIRVPIA